MYKRLDSAQALFCLIMFYRPCLNEKDNPNCQRGISGHDDNERDSELHNCIFINKTAVLLLRVGFSDISFSPIEKMSALDMKLSGRMNRLVVGL